METLTIIIGYLLVYLILGYIVVGLLLRFTGPGVFDLKTVWIQILTWPLIVLVGIMMVFIYVMLFIGKAVFPIFSGMNKIFRKPVEWISGQKIS